MRHERPFRHLRGGSPSGNRRLYQLLGNWRLPLPTRDSARLNQAGQKTLGGFQVGGVQTLDDPPEQRLEQGASAL
jgi:hypothetical protein